MSQKRIAWTMEFDPKVIWACRLGGLQRQIHCFSQRSFVGDSVRLEILIVFACEISTLGVYECLQMIS